MKSQMLGKNISDVEILNISNHGIWIFINNNEHFLSFKEYPWFKNASITQIYNFQLIHEQHLYWPDLDIDLELNSIINPAKYPLKYQN